MGDVLKVVVVLSDELALERGWDDDARGEIGGFENGEAIYGSERVGVQVLELGEKQGSSVVRVSIRRGWWVDWDAGYWQTWRVVELGGAELESGFGETDGGRGHCR